jgi:hypothetical protein
MTAPRRIARSFRVRCSDLDAEDTYRFENTGAGPREATFLAWAESLPKEIRRLRFAASAFATGDGVLAMSQTNEVTHEGPRAEVLRDTTPPFFLSRAHAKRAARDGVLRGLRFFDFLGPMPALSRDGSEKVEVSLFGEKRVVTAERFRSDDGDELLLLPKVDEFDDANLVLRVRRDDEFEVQLLGVEG